MTLHLKEAHNGKVLAVHVSGKLTRQDYEQFVPEFDRLVRQHGKLSVLFDMTDFHGWDAGALWEGTRFAIHHFDDIERIAMLVLRQALFEGSVNLSVFMVRRALQGMVIPFPKGATQPWALTNQPFGRYCGVPPRRYRT